MTDGQGGEPAQFLCVAVGVTIGAPSLLLPVVPVDLLLPRRLLPPPPPPLLLHAAAASFGEQQFLESWNNTSASWPAAPCPTLRDGGREGGREGAAIPGPYTEQQQCGIPATIKPYVAINDGGSRFDMRLLMRRPNTHLTRLTPGEKS